MPIVGSKIKSHLGIRFSVLIFKLAFVDSQGGTEQPEIPRHDSLKTTAIEAKEDISCGIQPDLLGPRGDVQAVCLISSGLGANGDDIARLYLEDNHGALTEDFREDPILPKERDFPRVRD